MFSASGQLERGKITEAKDQKGEREREGEGEGERESNLYSTKAGMGTPLVVKSGEMKALKQ